MKDLHHSHIIRARLLIFFQVFKRAGVSSLIWLQLLTGKLDVYQKAKAFCVLIHKLISDGNFDRTTNDQLRRATFLTSSIVN